MMDSPRAPSPFWLNFHFSSERRNVKDSVWNKFASPYDLSPCGTNPRAQSPPPGLSRCNRLGLSLPPVSPRTPRSVSLPRRTFPSLKTRKLNAALLSYPRASGQRFELLASQFTSDVQKKQGRLGTSPARKLKGSLSAESLGDEDDMTDVTCWGARRKPQEMSRSTDELKMVCEDLMIKYSQHHIHCGPSKSDDSLSTRNRINIRVKGSGSDSILVIKDQANKFSSLRRVKPNSIQKQDPSPERSLYISSSENISTIVKMRKRDRKPEDTKRTVERNKKPESMNSTVERRNQPEYTSSTIERNRKLKEEGSQSDKHPENIEADDEVFDTESRCVGKKKSDKILVSAIDHPQIVVRPGVSLPRSSSRSRAVTYPTGPQTQGSKDRSLVVTLPHQNQGYSTDEIGVRPRQDEDSVEGLVLDEVPVMPGLKINNLDFLGRSKRSGLIHRGDFFYGHADPGHRILISPDYAQSLLRATSLDASERNEAPGGFCGAPRIAEGEFEFGQGSIPRRCVLRHTVSLRSRSEERKKPSYPRASVSIYRHSAGASIMEDPGNPAVVSEDSCGNYRGVIFDGSSSARTGVFPPSLVVQCGDAQAPPVGGMGGRGKPTVAVKKVSPPTVPDSATHRHSGSSFSSGVYSAGDQRSSYSSSVSDENPPPSPRSPARGGGSCDHGQLGRPGGGGGGGGGGGQVGSNSPSHYNNQQQFTFPAGPHQQQVPQFAHLMCPKTSPGSPHHLPADGTYSYLTYQQQTSLEDQGIDVQSPGRSSPGSGSGSSTTGSTASSGCRNSTTSLDSGRASTTTHSHQHRLSGQSYDSGSILRHSYHSSSSSLGSMEHDNVPHVNVPELLNNGVRDSDVLRVWLSDLHFDEYYEKFINAGYDMPTISRMTPEDLNAIGITKPAHRKKLKAEITRLNISDGLPDFIPGRLEDWLSLLRLDEYASSLKRQQVNTIEQMTQLTWEDLEDIGITKLGHQKKVMLGIKRLKDIMAGKKFNNSQDGRPQSHYGAHEILIPREGGEGRDQFTPVPEFRTFSGPGHYGGGDPARLNVPPDSAGHYGPPHYPPGVQYGPMPPPQAHVHPLAQQGGQFHPPGQYSGSQGPSPPGSKLPSGPHPLPGPGQVQYHPDVLAVQIRPGGRSADEPIYGTYQTFHPESRMQHIPGPPMSLGNLPPRPFLPTSGLCHPHPQRSMDDGDITPTNEYANNYEGGGTLPRPRTANKMRPVAKVTAKTRVDVHEVPQFIKDGMNISKPPQTEEIGMKELNLKTLNRQNSEKSYSAGQGTGSSNNTPQGTPKKVPPPPPRRSNSISESSKEQQGQEGTYGYLRRGLSYGYMGIKNNLQPDVTPDLPPPPAPPDSANHQHLPDDFPPPPPPLTCVTMASAARISASSTITTSSMTSDSLATSQTSTTSDEDVTTGFRPRRNDSNASFKSNSSTDSESLPFANENAGTIKQRSCRPHPGLALDPRGSPHGSPRASPALRRKDASLTLRTNTTVPTDATPSQLPTLDASSPDGTSDVLSDIGNMLANLTDELDAMLEQEVVIKN